MRSALDALFRPAPIAVIGASPRPGTVGWQIVDNLLRHGFEGVVHPVNPSAASVRSIPAHPSVEEIPGPVDLAVVVVPKEMVVEVAEPPGTREKREMGKYDNIPPEPEGGGVAGRDEDEEDE